MHNPQTFKALALSITIGFFLQSCGQNSSQASLQSKTLTITGASTISPLVGEIAKRFEEKYSEVRVDVQTGGTSRGFSDAKQGISDIGLVSRSLTRKEKEEFFDFAIAYDGVAIILQKNNRVNSLSYEQITKIYTGKIKNWQEVGGTNAPIVVVHKATGRSTLTLFLDYFKLDNSQVKADIIIGNNQQGIKTVAENENAIGYLSIGSSEYEIRQGTPLKLLPLNGIEATIQTVQKGQFPLSRPLNLVTTTQPIGLTQQFIDFAQSEEVYDLVQAQYFVPLNPENKREPLE